MSSLGSSEDAHDKKRKTLWQTLNPLDRSNPVPVPKDAGVLPDIHASSLSRLVWGWMDHLMWVGYTRPLQMGDLWQVDSERSAKIIAELVRVNFDKRRERGGRFSLFWALSDSFRWRFWSAGVMKVMSDTLMTLNALLIKALITFSGEAYYAKIASRPAPHIGRGIGLAFGVFLFQVVASFLQHHFFYRSMMTGALSRSALISNIYRKSLVLSNKSRTEFTNGKITNLMSTDSYRIDFACGYAHMLWTSIVQMLLILVILLVNLGPSALAGFGLLVLSTPIMSKVVTTLAKKRKESTRFTDARVRLTQEILASMRIIKFYAWEKSFLAKLMDLRAAELKIVRFLLIMRSAVNAVAVSMPVFASILAFVTYSLSGNKLEAATVFSSLTLFNLLRMPLMFLPLVFSSMTDAYIALGRLQDMLSAEEVNYNRDSQHDAEKLQNDIAVSIERASFIWEEETCKDAPILQPKAPRTIFRTRRTAKAKADAAIATVDTIALDSHATGATCNGSKPFMIEHLSLTIPKGELVCIVGTVGSGKSSILSALVGEMRKQEGIVSLSGSVGYCAQVPWIQNASVKDNILFGREYDAKRYSEVIRACALEPDLEILPDGDATQIGERGITISGGQKQRLNIARAAYYDADIVLLDDPLSAVDAHVGDHLFEHCILGLLREKTRILVTHQLHILDRVDRIIVVKDGKITEMGTYTQLIESPTGEFAEILKQYGGVEEKSDDQVGDGATVKRSPPGTTDALKSPAGLIVKEDRETGAVSMRVYRSYFTAGGGLWTLPFMLLVLMLAQCANVGNNLWLSYWTSDQFNSSTGFYIGIYAAFGVAQALSYFLLGFTITVIGNKATNIMHWEAVNRVLRAPMSFFDTTPLGRVINRFSKDVDTMDNLLSDSFRMFLTTFASIVGSFILAIVIFNWFAVALVPLLFGFFMASLFYRASAREIKRLDSVLRSNVFAQFGETLTGLATVRAYGEQKRFMQQNSLMIDKMNGAYFMTITNQRWLGIRLDLVGNMLILVIAILAVTSRFNVKPATTGLVLSYTMQVVGMISWMVRQFAEVENNMNATERIHHYGNLLETEAPFTLEEVQIRESWPESGEIVLQDVVMAYRHGLTPVLKGLTLHIRGGERIGIVGRTGAGKSSIMVALYRMAELRSGSITIDGMDISKMGLHSLRSKLSIIPQDPILFQGTIRSNLDPFNLHSDQAIWDALKRSQFIDATEESRSGQFALDTSVDDEGLNFSLGQRQLLAMARALLRRSKILVLDEATSSVDFATDSRIQQTISTEFRNTTLLTIAHRLKTIIHYDRICVMDNGQVAEFDSPVQLFRKKDGIFSNMCHRSGIRECDFAVLN